MFPFAPPTHDWFQQSRAGESFKVPSYCICVDYGESKVLAAACYVYTCLYYHTQHLYMTMRSTQCGVAGNRFQTCMTSAIKDENKHRAREYTPALSRQINETQTAVKIQLTMQCVSDSIVSKKHVRM